MYLQLEVEANDNKITFQYGGNENIIIYSGDQMIQIPRHILQKFMEIIE